MKFIELFAGIGGFRYGLENVTASKREQSRVSKESKELTSNQHIKLGTQQFDCVYANEWDKYATQIYRRHYGEIDTRNIRDVSEFPDFNLLTAGFPCQDFSIAGKRAGLDGTRGTLFYEIARILKQKRPRHFLLENVKGLLSAQDGKNFPTILGVLSDLGYRVEWMVLNSKHFGVPQNRERVFIIGHLRGECSGEVFPVGENTGQSLKEYTSGQSQGCRVYDTEGISQTLASEAGGLGAKTGLYAMRGRNPDDPSDRTTGSPTEQRLELNEEGTTNTLTSVAKDNLWIENARIRRLTPVECERLQGFPDGWTEGVSDTQRYKCLGNAVTTNVITAIGTELLKHIIENEEVMPAQNDDTDVIFVCP